MYTTLLYITSALRNKGAVNLYSVRKYAIYSHIVYREHVGVCTRYDITLP